MILAWASPFKQACNRRVLQTPKPEPLFSKKRQRIAQTIDTLCAVVLVLGQRPQRHWSNIEPAFVNISCTPTVIMPLGSLYSRQPLKVLKSNISIKNKKL